MGFEHAKDCHHLTYAFVELPDGPMSSRKGNKVPVIDLIQNMEEKIKDDHLIKYKDEWTKEDWISIILSPLAYIGFAVGVALSVLLLKVGFIILGMAVVITALMHWLIDPKLRMISEEYERKQKHYLEELEKIERWEDFK